jgi:hypothetical protein
MAWTRATRRCVGVYQLHGGRLGLSFSDTFGLFDLYCFDLFEYISFLYIKQPNYKCCLRAVHTVGLGPMGTPAIW